MEFEKVMFTLCYKNIVHTFDLTETPCLIPYILKNNLNKSSIITIQNEYQNIDIDEDILTTFIRYCRKENIEINNKNVFQLRNLAGQFELPSLKERTQKYIDDNLNDLILSNLIIDQEKNKDNEDYHISIDKQKEISKNLPKFIENDLLVRLPIQSLYLILSLYKSKYDQTDEEMNQKIKTFLFKCLDERKRIASPLFSIFDFLVNSKECILELFEKYEEIFDFNYILPIIKDLLIQIYKDQKDEKIKEAYMELMKNKDRTKILFIPEKTKSIKFNEYKNNKCEKVVIPSSVELIDNNAFISFESLREIDFNTNSNLKYIGDSAFSGCKSLENISIPSFVNHIGVRCFHDCTSLTHIRIPNSVKIIRAEAFFQCKSLLSIELPHFLTIIERSAFCECEKLTSIEFPDSLKTIENNAFNKCMALQSLKLPKNMEIIHYRAFAFCSSLNSIEMSKSVTEIRDEAFLYCTSLQNVIFHESIKKIGNCSFYNCTKLTTVIIPATKSSIEMDASAFPTQTNIKYAESGDH